MANQDDAPVGLSRTGAGLPRRPARASLHLAPVRARRDSKRDAVLHAARDEFANNGFLGTHVAVVAARAGIRKSTFFHYYADKEALYDAAVATVLDEIANAVDDVVDSNTGVVRRLDALVESIHDHLAREAELKPSLPRLLLRGVVDAPRAGASRPTAVERIVARILDIAHAGAREGTWPPFDAARTAEAVLAVIVLFRSPDGTPHEARAELQARVKRLLDVGGASLR